jgi:1,6-anhydro-N-acetylmuramate kinase
MLNTERTQRSGHVIKQIGEQSTSSQSVKSTLEHQLSHPFFTTSVTKSQQRVEKTLLWPKKSERHIAAFMNDPL